MKLVFDGVKSKGPTEKWKQASIRSSLVVWAGTLKKWVLHPVLWASYHSAPHYSFSICRMGITILNCHSGLFRLYIYTLTHSFYCKTFQWNLNLDEAKWGKKSSLEVLYPGKHLFKVIIWGEWVPFLASITFNSVVMSMKVEMKHFRVSNHMPHSEDNTVLCVTPNNASCRRNVYCFLLKW